ncbi:MAG: COX15/CtaA family protein [Hyphomicrobiales bacterium]|nr:COX15/CtaA family protein [Hyphomicrobiales bacterium]
MTTALSHGANIFDTAGDRARPVVIWLYGMAALIFAMVIVGGATRLTDSGLSITEWRLILGAIPPLTAADWAEAFEKYRAIPEYQFVNKGMSLEAFKVIYWWEWAHRFLGRIIGLAFLAPFVWFVATGRIRPRETPRFIVLFLLGGAQGFLGWWMVQSGLSERVDVSQYRLAAHLGLAVVLFAAVLWTAFEWSGGARRATRAASWLAASAIGLCAAVYAQIVLGAFVAGLDAGHTHNTWPLMDGEFIPSTVGAITPWWRDIFENVSTVQFNHRLAAYLIVAWALAHAVWAWRRAGAAAFSGVAVGAAALGQAALGVWTVVAAVPIELGLAHQGGAIVLLGLALRHAYLMAK